ncbi:endo alpha-1,4 polygalactosaminidase [Celerinatantimonas sp. MCCC 1A17872]|uniref:endo alpha-1,4 polygalactosaminidase n=1 Tax=Celerinatantimonas sp. MCCC 1A17872 TaxID=3177514 RepID=UPI0038C29173
MNRCNWIFWLFIFFTPICLAKGSNQSIAFYYGQPMPLAEMTFYSNVVVQPDHINNQELTWLNRRNIKSYAYLSIGESAGQTGAVLGQNSQWSTQIMDLSSPQWRAQLYNRAKKLQVRGFHGLFLDTLNSYQLLDKKQQSIQQQALVEVILHLSKMFSGHLILNRGFDVLSQLKGKAEYIVAEGLFTQFNPINNSYHKTSIKDQKWIEARLNYAKSLGFKVEVIDYAKPHERYALAKRIFHRGYQPWVSDGFLQQWGTSTIKPVARRIIIPYNGKIQPLIYNPLHNQLAIFIEYLGYIPDYWDISKHPLPDIDPSLYAGIIVWNDQPNFYQDSLVKWLIKAQGEIPELLLGLVPNNSQLLKGLGGQLLSQSPKGPYHLTFMSPILKSEALPSMHGLDPVGMHLVKGAHALISLKTASGPIVQASMTSNGGIVLAPWMIKNIPMGDNRWIVNPMNLLTKVLKLPPIPAFDVTTVSGRRAFLLHMDGDGFPSLSRFPGQPYAGEEFKDKILKRYKLPFTFSVIEGEVGPKGLYPAISPKLEAIARAIFKLPYVEIATHTFSHPFFWAALAGRRVVTAKDEEYGFNLAVPNYPHVVLKREINGSINYINSRLAPKGKKVVMVLWSGDALPGPKPIALANAMHVLNVNGGNTNITSDNPSLTNISPIARPEGEFLWQIYAPIMNDDVFTNEWKGPFDGFKRVITTYKVTDKPYRLKPFDIYLHTYVAANPAGLKGVNDAIRYIQSKPNTPIHLSRYAIMAKDFYFSALAKDSQGRWLTSSKSIRTIRIPSVLANVDLKKSSGIAGVTQSGRYVSLIRAKAAIKLSTKSLNTQPYLLSANGVLKRWQVDGPVQLFSWVKAQINMANARHCRLVSHSGIIYRPHLSHGISQFELPKGTFRGQLLCNKHSVMQHD